MTSHSLLSDTEEWEKDVTSSSLLLNTEEWEKDLINNIFIRTYVMALKIIMIKLRK